MKRCFCLLVVLFIMHFCNANTIDEKLGKTLAWHFAILKNISIDSNDIYLVYKSSVFNDKSSVTAYYIYNYDTKGYVIISGMDNTIPVLAYSTESIFDTTAIPVNIKNYLDDYTNQIEYIIENKLTEDTTNKQLWNDLINNRTKNKFSRTTTVSPLLKTTWSQAPYYNYLCPLDTVSGKHAVTGCVATVMAQIMKYWNWPAIGIGSHSYTPQGYGEQMVDFSKNVYAWSAMPNALNYNGVAVATLMYNAGVAVNMQYGTKASNSYVMSANCPIKYNAQYALNYYFAYLPSMTGLYRTNYNDKQWIAIIEKELYANRPLIYDGDNDTEGHSFIADGFDNNDYIHFNWGWGGNYNGYFSINNLVPGGINLTQHHQILVGIQPDTLRTLVLADTIISTQTAYQSEPFTITTKVINITKVLFKGSFQAVLTSDDYPGLMATQIIDTPTIAFGDSAILNFSFPGMLPGKYTVTINFSIDGITYKPVGNTPQYRNNALFTIWGNPNLNYSTVFPNPANKYVYVDLNNTKASAYSLIDAMGKEIATSSIDTNEPIVAIPLSELSRGMYLIKIIKNDGIEVKKFILAW